jgi:hypothetical protein
LRFLDEAPDLRFWLASNVSSDPSLALAIGATDLNCALAQAEFDCDMADRSLVPVNNSDGSLALVSLDPLLAPVDWDCALAPVNSDYSLHAPVNSDPLLALVIGAADLNCALAPADFDTSPKMK